MSITSILLTLLALLIAGGITYFQYFHQSVIDKKVKFLLATLRFLAIFGILLLLVNPKIARDVYTNQKPIIAFFFDNSASIKSFKADQIANNFLNKIKDNKSLAEKFELHLYGFDREVKVLDSLNFKGYHSQLSEIPKHLQGAYKQNATAVVLVTDGQSTIGADYRYAFDPSKRVLPLVLGDTTTVIDLKIGQINVNKYALYKNKFPVEVFVEYNGNQSVQAQLNISNGGGQVFSKALSFSPNQSSQRVEALLEASPVGLQIYNVSISSNISEANQSNNKRNFAIEVIDQKSEIAIISQLSHPDIGTIKRAIESNKYRKVSVLKPSQVQNINDFNAIILYQPNNSFQKIFDNNKNLKVNQWIITGKHTDYGFLNRMQSQISFNMSNAKEDYLASYKRDFSTFILDDIGFNSFPPLENAYGNMTFKGKHDDLLNARLRNLALDQPLMSFTEENAQKQVWLFGENIWKWRLQDHLNHQKFDKFDVFIDKIIQYLSSQDKKKNLVVQHENFYQAGDRIEISAQFFNKNFEFDENAKLQITLTNKQTNKVLNQSFLRGANAYKLNLEGLESGQYNFTVKEMTSNTSYSSFFEIIPFDVEKQYVNPNLEALQYVANQTNGQLYFQNQDNQLINDLLKDNQYKTIQKSKSVISALIDWYWLLALILLALTIEWLLRKYHGLL